MLNKNPRRQLIQFILPVIQCSVLLSLIGCSGVTSIQNVQQHPRRHWYNSTVQLRGKVVDRVPLINAEVYQLEDATGKIWVLTSEPTQQAEQQVQVQGKVQIEEIQVEGLDLGEPYIQEQQRQMIQPAQ